MNAVALQQDDAHVVRTPAEVMADAAWACGWTDADVTRIDFRPPCTVAVLGLYGASLADVVRAVCRRLRLAPWEIEAERDGKPGDRGWSIERFWIVRRHGADVGQRLARIQGGGMTATYVNLELSNQLKAGWTPPLHTLES